MDTNARSYSPTIQTERSSKSSPAPTTNQSGSRSLPTGSCLSVSWSRRSLAQSSHTTEPKHTLSQSPQCYTIRTTDKLCHFSQISLSNITTLLLANSYDTRPYNRPCSMQPMSRRRLHELNQNRSMPLVRSWQSASANRYATR